MMFPIYRSSPSSPLPQALLLLLPLQGGLGLLPYYIQTDEGEDRSRGSNTYDTLKPMLHINGLYRFFQFSSGDGGQYRR